MARSSLMLRTALIMPLVLVTVALLEDVATYKVRQHVHNVYARAGIVLLLNGIAFAIAAEWFGPWIKRGLAAARKSSHREAGVIGLWFFCVLAYGALYWSY